MLFEESGERLAEYGFGGASRFYAPQLAFRLALELDLAQFDGDDGREPLEHIVAGKALALFAAAVLGIQCARECGLESGDMCAALGVVDIVGECTDTRGNVVGILKRDLHLYAILFFLNIKNKSEE